MMVVSLHHGLMVLELVLLVAGVKEGRHDCRISWFAGSGRYTRCLGRYVEAQSGRSAVRWTSS